MPKKTGGGGGRYGASGVDQSYGAIPLRRGVNGWEVFVIQHKGGGHWGFPKGHQDAGETNQQTAIRELFEETGFKVDSFGIDGNLANEEFVEVYEVQKRNYSYTKTVTFWIALIDPSAVYTLQAREVIEGRWCTIPNAKKLLTYAISQDLLQKVADAIGKL